MNVTITNTETNSAYSAPRSILDAAGSLKIQVGDIIEVDDDGPVCVRVMGRTILTEHVALYVLPEFRDEDDPPEITVADKQYDIDFLIGDIRIARYNRTKCVLYLNGTEAYFPHPYAAKEAVEKWVRNNWPLTKEPPEPELRSVTSGDITSFYIGNMSVADYNSSSKNLRLYGRPDPIYFSDPAGIEDEVKRWVKNNKTNPFHSFDSAVATMSKIAQNEELTAGIQDLGVTTTIVGELTRYHFKGVHVGTYLPASCSLMLGPPFFVSTYVGSPENATAEVHAWVKRNYLEPQFKLTYANYRTNGWGFFLNEVQVVDIERIDRVHGEEIYLTKTLASSWGDVHLTRTTDLDEVQHEACILAQEVWRKITGEGIDYDTVYNLIDIEA